MPLPFLNGHIKKREQIIAVDLGGRSTKAVHLQRKGDTYTLLGYCVLDAPLYEKNLPVDLLSDHLKTIHHTLDAKTKSVTLSISVNDSIVRQTELPEIPVNDMRMILKNNTKTYLQQDLPGHVFDCYFILNRLYPRAINATSQKLKVLVGGAKKQLTDDLQSAVRLAGLVPDAVVPGLIGPINAFEMAMPDVYSKDAVALVDIGFKSTSICLLQKGELIVSRVVNIGGDKLTQGLAEAMSISYAEAEGIKVGMPGEGQSNLEPLLMPLGRELRASIDFFEHQQDRTISAVYISGGSARSDFILKTLQTELTAPCRSWSPITNVQMALPPAQVTEIEHVGPQLAVAMGAGVAAF